MPEHYYISLDKYKDTIQNNNITNMQEAWLMLLLSTDLNRIEELIKFETEVQAMREYIKELESKK